MERQLRFDPTFGRSRKAAFGLAAVMLAGLAGPAVAVGAGGPGIQSPEQPSMLGFAPLLPRADVGAPARIEVAQSQVEAQLQVRIQQLEEQIRNLTGQVEGLQFQLTQMQTLIERLNEDIDFRFQALEGGAGKKTEAATQSDGVTPSGASPQDQGQAVPADSAPPAETAPPAATADAAAQPAVADPALLPAEGAALPPVAAGAVPGEAPIDDLGNSADPLLGVGVGEESILGTLPGGDLGGKALDLDLANVDPNAGGDAAAQYQAGYDAIVRGDYAFAEEQFRQFVALYPQHARAPDAANWLGEALLHRGAYDEAADVLLTGYQNYPDSPARPDLLLKLGVALAGAGETETACRTFAEVAKRYPDQPGSFTLRLGEERAKAKCPS